MTQLTPIVVLLGAAGILLVVFLYLRRELDVPGRGLLLGFRIVALATVVALLLDLRIPTGASELTTEGGAWVLVEPDLSLTLPGAGDGTLWDEAVAEAVASSERGARLAVSRSGAEALDRVDPDGLRERAPRHPAGNVVEAVVRLGEGGADSVAVVSTLRWPDGAVDALREESPVPIRLERIGGLVRNVGVGELTLTESVDGDGELEGRVSIFGEGGQPGDSARVEVRANGALLQELALPLPRAGAESEGLLLLPPAPDTGRVRYTARAFLEGDLFELDDLKARWLAGEGERGGIVLLSLRPDWEPRTLLPVLEAVSGMRGQGYLALADDRYLPLVEGGEAASPVGSGPVADRASTAEILVVHGADRAPPAWLAELVGAHPRVLFLAGSAEAARFAGVSPDAPVEGAWTLVPDLPPSPLSPFLSGIALGGLPPLSVVVPVDPGTAAVGLNAIPSGGGEPAPLLLFAETGTDRRVVALGEGFWRWGVREGEARRAYRSLWAGVAGWLVAGEAGAGGNLRPVAIVQPRGEPLRWEGRVPPEGLEITLSPIHDGGDGPVTEEVAEGEAPAVVVVLEPGAELAASAPVDPGIYVFEAASASAGAEASDSIVARGLVEVERWAPSLRFPPLDASSIETIGAVTEANPDTQGRLLRTHPLPYLILLFALCAEWFGRRRVGLR